MSEGMGTPTAAPTAEAPTTTPSVGVGETGAAPAGNGAVPNLSTEGTTGSEVPPESTAQSQVLDHAAPPDQSHLEWLNAFPEEHRTNQNLMKYKSMDDFVNGYDNLQKAVGQKGVRPPTSESTPEEHAAWRDFIGAPEIPTKYDAPQPLKNAAGEEIFSFEESHVEEIYQRMHQANFTNDQAKMVMDEFQNQYVRMAADEQQSFDNERTHEYDQTVNTLRKEWGQNYELHLSQAQAFIQANQMTEFAKETGISNNASWLKMMQRLANRGGENTVLGTTNPINNHMSMGDQLKAIQNDPNLSKKEVGLASAELFRQRNESIGRH